MKRLQILLLTIVSIFNFSCSNSDDSIALIPIEPEVPEIVDDYKLLSVNSEGKIFEIGNNTGEITNIGQIQTVANLIQLSTICKVGTKIYAIESSYVPAPNTLIIYDQLTGNTTTQHLILPLSISSTMMDPFITNLEYNGSELVAIVSENMPSDSHPNKMVSINLQNLQTTDLDINFFQSGLTSTELINNKLYVSTRMDGLLAIDLTAKTVTEIQANSSQINGTRLVNLGNSKLGFMKFGAYQVVNGVVPFEFNLNNNSLTDKSGGNIFAVGNITGGTIFHNEEYLNIVYNASGDFGLLKINYENNERNFIALENNALGGNTIIVSILE